ncbi:hypothetical protein KIN20_003011 [Parelaphostrongylus tenuis]|uniref:Uncharacterized protein n=1 Tax=Parelaphostrongylus tenuis TaxID=148309 RepID=A0AAD5QH52_PARTN|nr:hypothetical protein KIN20_003011 [Parelaphostrongylus tenuis]
MGSNKDNFTFSNYNVRNKCHKNLKKNHRTRDEKKRRFVRRQTESKIGTNKLDDGSFVEKDEQILSGVFRIHPLFITLSRRKSVILSDQIIHCQAFLKKNYDYFYSLEHSQWQCLYECQGLSDGCD